MKIKKEVKKKSKFTLELNSHSLSYFQQCEKRYKFSEIELLTLDKEYYPFKRGEGIARYLALWYKAKQRNYSAKKLERLEEFLFKKMARSKYFVSERYKIDDKLHIASRLMGYFNKYRTEPYPVISVEQGFSKIIYESSNVLFVYSGRPDLVVDFGGNWGHGVIDHKSESRRNDLDHFSNQFLGYCWGLSTNIGLINYIGLQKDAKDNEILRREAFSFTASQIDKWQSDTIEWYHRIMRSVVSKSYLRSWRCEGKYGTCVYYPLCTSMSNKEEQVKMNRDFVKLEKAYKSW